MTMRAHSTRGRALVPVSRCACMRDRLFCMLGACEVLLSTLTQLRRRFFQAASWFGSASRASWPGIFRMRFSWSALSRST